MVNSTKIKARMVEMGLSQKDVAEALGIAPCTVSQKINNVRPFDLDEAEKLTRLLKITCAEFGLYFFCRQVAECNKMKQIKLMKGSNYGRS